MSALGKLFMLVLVVVATLLGYDYYLFKNGPKKWWRFWVKEAPAAPAAPVATPVAAPPATSAPASKIGAAISTSAKTA
jgi:hypothetical protein